MPSLWCRRFEDLLRAFYEVVPLAQETSAGLAMAREEWQGHTAHVAALEAERARSICVACRMWKWKGVATLIQGWMEHAAQYCVLVLLPPSEHSEDSGDGSESDADNNEDSTYSTSTMVTLTSPLPALIGQYRHWRPNRYSIYSAALAWCLSLGSIILTGTIFRYCMHVTLDIVVLGTRRSTKQGLNLCPLECASTT